MSTLRWILVLLGLLVPAALAAAPTEPGFHLEAIRIEPPDEAVERAVLAQLRFAPGQPIATAEILAAERTLELSGFFHEVDVHTERGRAPGQIVLVVSGQLDRSAHLESGFSHEPVAGWVLDVVGVRWNSPFHRGGHARVGLRMGLRTTDVYGEWMRPRLFGRNLDLLVELGGRVDRWLVVDGEDLYRQQIDRGRLRTGLRLHPGRRVEATLWLGRSSAAPAARLRGVGIEGEDAGRLVPAPGEAAQYSDLGLDLRWVPVRRDEVWRDTRSLGATLRASSIDAGGGFATGALDLGVATPWGERGAVAWQGTAAWSSVETPYHLRPVFGGTGSVRGFRDASLSGPLGARASWLAGIELRRRLMTADDGRARLVGQVFADVGQHWSASGQPADLSAAAGYGVRVRVPWVQVFGVDVGIPLTPTVTGDGFWVHATLGFRF